MSSWSDLEAAVPDLATFIRERFDAHRHKIMATLRADGSPRISGVEITFHDGEVWIGGMPGARKSADLRRDPRVAIHSGSDDPPGFQGDARLTGLAMPIDEPAVKASFMKAAGGGDGGEEPAGGGAAGGGGPDAFDLFRLEICEASTVRVGKPADHLVIELWRPGEALQRFERR